MFLRKTSRLVASAFGALERSKPETASACLTLQSMLGSIWLRMLNVHAKELTSKQNTWSLMELLVESPAHFAMSIGPLTQKANEH